MEGVACCTAGWKTANLIFLKEGYKSVTHSFAVYGIRNWILSGFSLALCSDTLYPGTPGSEVSFARQHNTSDNNNQCFLGSNGNALLQLNPQKPGAIDNQPLVTQEPVKVKQPRHGNRGKANFIFYHSFFNGGLFQLNSELMLLLQTAKFRFLTLILRGKNCVLLLRLLLCLVRKEAFKIFLLKRYLWKDSLQH